MAKKTREELAKAKLKTAENLFANLKKHLFLEKELPKKSKLRTIEQCAMDYSTGDRDM